MAFGTCTTALAASQTDPLSAWAPIGLLVLIALVFAVGTLGLSVMIGRSRTGPVKGTPYESGIEPTGDAHRRFNVRYYLLGITFLVFDVELVVLLPWAVIFLAMVAPDQPRDPALLIAGLLFMGLILAGYVYEWRRGALRFD